jgi:hypothetical protein
MCRRLALPMLLLLAGGLAQVHAQDVQWIKAAYWDERYGTGWADLASSIVVRDGLAAAGYEVLDADQLKTWMQDRIKDKKYSVVVMCKDWGPDTVCETMSATCTLRKYLDAGGKIVFYADIPFYYQGAKDGTSVTWGEAGANAILGIGNVSVWDSGTTTTITKAGEKWGLSTTWASVRPYAANSPGFVVLATDGSGNAAAWQKSYAKNDTFRGFVRLWDRGGYPPVAEIIKVAEYVAYKATDPSPADGDPSVTLPLLMWSPSSFAVLHNVYLGTTPELTEADLVLSRVPQLMYYSLTPLTPGVTYYWRVDEITASNTVITGDVWSFQAMPLTAYLPQPADKAVDVSLSPTLSWAAGQLATGHHVYFGADRSAVEAGAAETDMGPLDADVTSYKVADALKPDSTYFWRVDETDMSSVLHTGPVWSFDTVRAGPVGAIYEYWLNIGSGTAVTDLTGNANYPDNPTGSYLVTLFEGPVNWADNYGSRLYGWLYPPQSGDYTFWIASDDLSELWLSTDEDPANATLIASVSGWMDSRDFAGATGVPGTTFKSNPIKLEAGQRYYIQALQKEGGGGDNVAVAWQGPGFTQEVLGAGGVGPTPYLPQKAYSPFPADGAVDTVQSLTLTWSAGEKALQHELYLGDDANAVAAADSSSDLFKGSLSSTSYNTGELEWGKTFYWRVDEINTGEADSPWVGRVWSFTTANFTPVDDFESYNDVEGTDTRIYETWIDGYTDGLSGSIVGNFDPPFAETTIVHGGAQSMPIDYDNSSSPFYSQAYREFSPVMNWTGNGVTDLSLWVRGNAAGVAPVTEVGSAMSVTGEGADIWGAADQFTFVYKSLNGDGSLLARVVSIGTGSSTWAKGGVMVRASLEAGSASAQMCLTGGDGNGAAFQNRAATDLDMGANDSTSNATAATAIAPPYWVKIERMGDTLSGYISPDGNTNTWTQVGTSQYITMDNPALIGFCVTSHAAGEYRTFEFDNIKATGAGGSWQTREVGLTRNSQQPLYVIVEDSTGKQAKVVDPNAAAVNITTWTEWKIPLSDLAPVNLAKVERLYIGVGDPDNPAADGTGRVYIDDIRVTKPPAE